MTHFLKQSVKVTLLNMIGYLSYLLYSLIIAGILYLLLFLEIGAFTIGGIISWDISALRTGITVIGLIVIIFTVLIMVFLQSVGSGFMVGGLYGTACDALFEKQTSLKSYFYHSLRNTLPLMGWQWIIFVIPTLFILILSWLIGLLTYEMNIDIKAYNLNIILPAIIVIFYFLLVYLFHFMPLLIVRYRGKVWQSLGWSLRLVKQRFPKTVLAFLQLVLPQLLVTLLYFCMAALLFIAIDSLPFSKGLIVTLAVIIIVAAIAFWALVLFPFMQTVSVMLSIRYFKRHLESALPEAIAMQAETNPFTYKAD